MMDFCDAVGIEPVFTTNAVGPETPQDMADLVEYLYGDETTTWGKLRIGPTVSSNPSLSLGLPASLSLCLSLSLSTCS